MQGSLERNQVIEGNANAARKKGFEAAAINIIAINRQRPIGQPMKSVLAVDVPERPVAARANLMAASTASDPEFKNNALSR